jgi:hypothetical protein
MILGVSIGRAFDDYGFLYKRLSAIQFTEIASVPNDLLKRFCKESNKPFQEIEVFWKDIRGCKNIKEGRFGKYNGDAMKEAIARLVDYSEVIIEFGGGAYNLPKEGKEKLIKGGGFVKDEEPKRIFKF